MAQLTTVAAIYQASENLYQLFDKVCVIGEGRMFYFGPSQDARKYFEDLGYYADPRQTTSDFLVSGILKCVYNKIELADDIRLLSHRSSKP